MLSEENTKHQEYVHNTPASTPTNSTQGFTISITQNGKEKNEVDGGAVCIFSLKGNGADIVQAKGQWICPAFKECAKDKYMAIRDSAGKTYKIAFVVDGKEIASKDIKIKKANE